jgi:transglutaminase-like putative cysteine protease
MSEPGTVHAPRFLVPAEVALFAVSVATIYGFSRLFADGGFFVPMLVTAMYSHGITLLTRRRGYGVPASALIAFPLLLLLLTWLFFFDTTLVGIPTGETLDAVSASINESWAAFQNVLAPAPALSGFVLASCAALFFAIFLADWAAFRLWSAFEAIVPASTLFIFCSLLGSPVHQVDATAVFLAAVLGFLLLHRIARQETSSSWLTADIERGSRSALRTGAVLTVAALAAGVVLGPRLPGASSPAMISWRDADSGPGSRVTISPLVDIQDRLTNQSNTEVFTVRSNERSYWRMTSLDTFEGDIWRSGGKYQSADGDLPSFVPEGVTTTDLDQRFTISNLAVLWLPAAFEPRFVNSPSAEVRYQPDSSTLIVDTDVDSSDGLQYEVRSTQSDFSPDQLRAASQAIPQDIAERYTALPGDFSPTARSLAEQITAQAGATTAYDEARALQDHFQLGDYTYDLSVPRGHGESAIDEFLSVKRGYCEQFAGTYAAMARSLGLPARVAVGFTPGEQDPNDPTLFRVNGKHAHAWPEVYLGEYGWVSFEPTPGRGAPNAEQWTGIPEQQDATPVAVPATTAVPVNGTTPGNGPLEDPNDPFASTTLPKPLDQELDAGGSTEPPGPLASPVVRAASGASLVLVLLGIYALAMVLLAAHRLRRRRELATTDRTKIQVAWQESVEALELIGTRAQPSETHEEFARRAQASVSETGTALLDLAHDVNAAAYAPAFEVEGMATRAGESASIVIAAARAQVTPTQRWRHVFDPRPHLPRLGLASRRRASSKG